MPTPSARCTRVLELGQVTESITVGGSVSQVDTVGATLKEIIDERRITELPLNGRNALQLVRLLPGAVSGGGNNGLGQNDGISVNGARGTANNYLLDGGDNNDPQFNTAALIPNPDSLEEFSVQTNNFSAEYGRNSGAIINAVTKSGTNKFHGSAYEFLRNDAMDARSFFALEKGKLRRNQFGGSVGGPIIRDRTFFFGSYEGLARTRPALRSPASPFPPPQMRAGDFSSFARKILTIRGTARPFPGGIIPSNRFDAGRLNFLDKLQGAAAQRSRQPLHLQPPQSRGPTRTSIIGRVDHLSTSRSASPAASSRARASSPIPPASPCSTPKTASTARTCRGSTPGRSRPCLLGVRPVHGQPDQDRPRPAPHRRRQWRRLRRTSASRSIAARRIPLASHWSRSTAARLTAIGISTQDNLVTIDRRTYQGTYYALLDSRPAPGEVRRRVPLQLLRPRHRQRHRPPVHLRRPLHRMSRSPTSSSAAPQP